MIHPDRVIQFLEAHNGEAFRPSQILEALDLSSAEKGPLRRLLRELSDEGRLIRFRRGAYSAGRRDRQNVVEGYVRGNERGFGFVAVEGGGQEDVYIPRSAMRDALHGDWVELALAQSRDGRVEGRILRVLRRANKTIVGQFASSGEGGVVFPRNEKIARIVRVPGRQAVGRVPEGAWVEVAIEQFSESRNEPLIGKIQSIIGRQDDPGIDILTLLRGEGVVPEFPEEALREAEAFERAVEESEIARRLDLRAMPILTIDPQTAKDFDDALSVEPLDGGAVRLGVHIADVAHFVREGSALDAEARDRATSIYPVDRVVPMLPPRLSDDFCSLRPNEDRLAMSVFIVYDANGAIRQTEVRESVIHSSLRLAYEEVQDFFDEKPFPRASELEALRPSLIGLRDLARRLNRMRMERGALDLDMPEAMVVMGPEGEVKDVRERERLESHRLVEECMLAANEAMARLMAERHLPGLYRIHEEPDPKSLERLAVKLHPFGVRLPAREIKPEDLQAAIARVAKMEGGSILMRIILRSLKKARYSERNQGHHGLASACYCHFTSPIRRYPDLIVHRVIKEWLAAGRLSPERQADWEDAAPQLAEHTSMREVRADDIERMAMDIMSLKFLQPNVGEVVDGMISDLAPIGFFVRLDPWPIEGLVHVRSLEDDRYDFDEDIYALRGQRTGRLFRPTQKVRVFIEKVDPLGRRLDLKLVDARPAKAGSAPSGKAGGAARRAEKRGRKSKDAKGKKGRKRK